MSEEKQSNSWTFKDWYSKNKKSLAERRKSKYQSDPSYRNKVLERNKEYRKIAKLQKGQNGESRSRLSKPYVLDVEINGEIVSKPLFRVGYLAKSIDRSVATIHSWERSGLLPRTPFLSKTSKKMERLYTEDMINVVKQILAQRSRHILIDDHAFTAEIINGWRSFGISMGE